MDPAVRRRTVLAGIGVAVAGCASDGGTSERTPTPDEEREPLSGSWPTFAHDTKNTGYASTIDGPYTEINREWTFGTDDPITASPVTAGNTLYVASVTGTVHALDPYVGAEIWSFETNGPITATPAIADGTVYVGSGDE